MPVCWSENVERLHHRGGRFCIRVPTGILSISFYDLVKSLLDSSFPPNKVLAIRMVPIYHVRTLLMRLLLAHPYLLGSLSRVGIVTKGPYQHD